MRMALRRQAGAEGLGLLLEVTEVFIVSNFRNLPGFAYLIDLDAKFLDLLAQALLAALHFLGHTLKDPC
jgi:hypothetical protein